MLHPRDSLARAFGVAPDDRERLIRSMLERHARDRVAYWLELTLSMGIATLGLVLDSTVVVIGAMLVAPLMNPIVELGVGLAIGSPLLVTRSFVRVAGSVLFVVAGAAAITAMLPYHELTSQIAARTSPTVLDLSVAVLCAVAAAFSTVRGSQAMGVASGTAIGISLVPPLCVVGYGLGTLDGGVAFGALLLFTANVTAIVLVAVGAFLLLRFDAVDVYALERDAVQGGAKTSRIGRVLHRLFGARYGRALRVLMPMVIMVGVYVPLRRALEEVTWQVRVRARLTDVIEHLPLAKTAIRSSVSVGNHSVAVHLAVVGSADDAARLSREIEARAAAVAGVRPVVDVVAVPTAEQLRHLALASRGDATTTVARPPAATEIDDGVRGALGVLWPGGDAGALARWRLSTDSSGRWRAVVVHVGARLGGAATDILARDLGDRLHVAVTVEDHAYPPLLDVAATGADAGDGGEMRLSPEALAADIARARAAVESDGLFPCEPPPDAGSALRVEVEPCSPVTGADAEAEDAGADAASEAGPCVTCAPSAPSGSRAN